MFGRKWSKKDKPYIRTIRHIALIFALVLMASFALTGCEDEAYVEDTYYQEADGGYSGEEISESAYEYTAQCAPVKTEESTDDRYGSSGKLEGTIAVVTILADDTATEWNLSDKADFNMYSIIYKDLRIGCEWIEEACAEYGRDVNFIWDWVAHKELIHRTSVNRCISNDDYGTYFDMYDFISNNIDNEGIKSALGANGIIYMVCVNTPSSNTMASRTFSWEINYPCKYEMCLMLMNYKGQINSPSVFAHETLHTFGAPDLYLTTKRGITQEYVDYGKSANTNDIMRATWDLNTNRYDYDRVTNEITDVTAYYLGLTDYSETVQQWGLGQSDYAYYGDTAAQTAGTTSSDSGGGTESGTSGWWNMLNAQWKKSDWTYEDGEWYLYDEKDGWFYIYMESYGTFAAMNENDDLYYLDNATGTWVEVSE